MYDIVRSNKIIEATITDKDNKVFKEFIQEGTKGTIVHIHDNSLFLIDFLDDNNESIGFYSVKSEDIELVWKSSSSLENILE